MSHVLDFAGPIFRASIELAPGIPLHVHLVKGNRYAVWIDSGVASMYPRFLETMSAAGVEPGELRFILHTHSHHDHIGANAQVQDWTGCLIAAHPYYAAWHADFERHYQEFSRPFPHLIPDTPALRQEVLGVLDAPRPLDVHLEEGMEFDLGGVRLQAIYLPGHMLAEFGWLERSTRTLILGDAITGLDWPLFHSHLSVQGYRLSLERIRRVLAQDKVEQVLFAHFEPLLATDVEDLIVRAERYIDGVEATVLRIIAEGDEVSLERAWIETCRRMQRMQEFRSLNMVHAHLRDLTERGLLRQTAPEMYQLR